MLSPKMALAPVLVILLGAVPADAADLDAGLRAPKQGDYATASKEWRPLAEQRNADAQYNLAMMYDLDHGVSQDYAEAVKWHRRAAEQGDARAQRNLVLMYAEGAGLPQDYIEAHKWIKLAASREKPGADRDKVVKDRDLVAAKMTPAQIAGAQRLAREWKPKSEKP